MHTGYVEGAKSATLMLPEKRIGMAVLLNSEDGAARWALVYRLLDHYLDLPPTDWIAPLLKARDEQDAKAVAELRSQMTEARLRAWPVSFLVRNMQGFIAMPGTEPSLLRPRPMDWAFASITPRA